MIINTIHATTRKGIIDIDQPNPLHFAADDQLRRKYFKILLRPKNPTRIRKKKLMARRSSGDDNNQGIHSSLALLQERFNQLQKTRKMRQERELMRLISDAQERHASSNNNNCISNSSAIMHYHHHQASMSSDFELAMFHQQRPSSQLGLSLQPDYSQLNRTINYGDEEDGSSPQETKSWLLDTNLGLQTPLKFDHDSTTASDVDTSLRL